MTEDSVTFSKISRSPRRISNCVQLMALVGYDTTDSTQKICKALINNMNTDRGKLVAICTDVIKAGHRSGSIVRKS